LAEKGKAGARKKMKKAFLFLIVFTTALLAFFGSSFASDIRLMNLTSPVAYLSLGLGLWGFSVVRRKRPVRK
jgi:hypothetical protein